MQRRHLELVWLRGIGSLKADAQNSYLGTLWWVLEPILLSGIFYLAFATGLRGTSGPEFAIFLLCGLLPYKWTASCINTGANALLNNKGIMGQTYLPKWIFPATTNLAMAIRFIFVLPVLLGVIVYSGGEIGWNWMSLVYVVACQLLLNLGLSYMFAAGVPLFPDLTHLVGLLTLMIMFSSGIFFDINDRPPEIQAILRWNPFIEIIDAYRMVLLKGGTAALSDVKYALTSGLTALGLGYALLSRFDRYYPRALP